MSTRIFIDNHLVGHLKNGETKTFVVTKERALLSAGSKKKSRSSMTPFRSRVKNNHPLSDRSVPITESKAESLLYEAHTPGSLYSLFLFLIILFALVIFRWSSSLQKWSLQHPVVFLVFPVLILLLILRRKSFVITTASPIST